MEENRKHLSELAESIAADTAKLDAYFKESETPVPSLTRPGGPPMLMISPNNVEISEVHQRLISNTNELNLLLQGPTAVIWRKQSLMDAFALDVIYKFDIANKVPLGGSVDFESIAAETGIDASIVSRILRYAMTNFLFQEPEPGKVAHTAATAIMAQSSAMKNGVGIVMNEVFPASAFGAEALLNDGKLTDPKRSGWGTAHSADAPMFEELAKKYPERAAVASSAMDAYASRAPLEPLVNGYAWSELGEGTVVDLGGNNGSTALALARRYERLSFVVQDFEGSLAEGARRLEQESEGIKRRITFCKHNFFEEQPIHGADVYLFRSVMHDWPDQDCITMLKRLTPALKPGSKIVINDFVMPKPGSLMRSVEREQRSWDMVMMNLLTGLEREASVWTSLFERAHKDYKFLGVRTQSGAPQSRVYNEMSIIEAVWQP